MDTHAACERPYLLRDEMIQGAFATMHHTHRFSEDHDGTLMKDDFHFTAPLGFLGRIAETLFLKSYMKHFLTQRAQVLKRMAEGEEWRYYLKNDHLQPSPTP